MQGYQLTFFTQQDRRHGWAPLGEWLLKEALNLSIGGATFNAVAQGFGHHRKLNSAHFFELTDQPIEVTMALSEMDAERLFQRLCDENTQVFHVKIPIEFGMTGAH